MKTKFYIQYWDKFMNTKHEIIKAKDQYDAEKKWYNKHPQTLIKKISLV